MPLDGFQFPDHQHFSGSSPLYLWLINHRTLFPRLKGLQQRSSLVGKSLKSLLTEEFQPLLLQRTLLQKFAQEKRSSRGKRCTPPPEFVRSFLYCRAMKIIGLTGDFPASFPSPTHTRKPKGKLCIIAESDIGKDGSSSSLNLTPSAITITRPKRSSQQLCRRRAAHQVIYFVWYTLLLGIHCKFRAPYTQLSREKRQIRSANQGQRKDAHWLLSAAFSFQFSQRNRKKGSRTSILPSMN